MSDATVEALKTVKAFAEERGAIVDRVEVAFREQEGHMSVEFTGHLSPIPLEQATVCIGYQLDDTTA